MKGRTVLELGSGVGLAGMAAALLRPASVTMTDTVEMLPLMKRNVMQNFGEGLQMRMCMQLITDTNCLCGLCLMHKCNSKRVSETIKYLLPITGSVAVFSSSRTS